MKRLVKTNHDSTLNKDITPWPSMKKAVYAMIQGKRRNIQNLIYSDLFNKLFKNSKIVVPSRSNFAI